MQFVPLGNHFLFFFLAQGGGNGVQVHALFISIQVSTPSTLYLSTPLETFLSEM